MGLCNSKNEGADSVPKPPPQTGAWHQPPPTTTTQPLYDGQHPPKPKAVQQLAAGQKPSPLVTAASVHPPGSHHEVLWFPDPALPCRHVNDAGGGCRRGANCTFSHTATSLSRFLDVLRSAHRTLDICVYNITLDEISDLVIGIHKHGVRVRCISDAEQVSSSGSDIVRFKEAGIEVRTNQRVAPYGGVASAGINHSHAPRSGGNPGSSHVWAPLMHHKFCLIDGKMLVNGSFNWSRSAVLSNWENITVQDAPFLVQEYGKEFERLWRLFG